jgi:DNA-binding XRE family transcriptional regulator
MGKTSLRVHRAWDSVIKQSTPSSVGCSKSTSTQWIKYLASCAGQFAHFHVMTKKRKKQPLSQEVLETAVALKQIRETLGMTQFEFAVALGGIDPHTISRCERGLYEITMTILQWRNFMSLWESYCQKTGKNPKELPDYLGKTPNLVSV